MTERFPFTLAACLFAATVLGCKSHSLSPVAAAELKVGLISLENSYAADEPIVVRYFLENSSDRALSLLPWGTPLEAPLMSDSFSVATRDQQSTYQGIVVKRLAPVESDYLEIQAGGRIEADVVISRAYDMRAAGTYTVQLKNRDGVYSIGSTEFSLVTAPLEINRVAN